MTIPDSSSRFHWLIDEMRPRRSDNSLQASIAWQIGRAVTCNAWARFTRTELASLHQGNSEMSLPRPLCTSLKAHQRYTRSMESQNEPSGPSSLKFGPISRQRSPTNLLAARRSTCRGHPEPDYLPATQQMLVLRGVDPGQATYHELSLIHI